MTKEEAKNKLRKAGYQVVDDNSVVTVIVPVGTSFKNTIKDVKAKLSSWGYDESFAIKQHKGGDIENVDELASVDSFDVGEDYSEDSDAGGNDIKDDATETMKSDNDIKSEKKTDDSDDDFLDEDDDSDNPPEMIKIDEEDMDMILGEDSIQFSLEDFGMGL